MNKLPSTPRECAWRSLIQCDKNGRYSNLELDSVLKRSSLSPKDKNLYTALFYGVIERRISLDHLISNYSNRPLSDLSIPVANLLRLGLYQLFYLEKVPDNAAVNECVKMIKETKEAAAAPFINAVLRSACRNQERTLPFSREITEIEKMSIGYSYPLWMTELWCDAYGSEQAKSIMEEQNRRAPLTLRVNTLLTSREQLAERFRQQGIDCQFCEESPYALRIQGNYSLSESQELKEGLFFVQDLASQIACIRLDPKPGETIFDVCSCPGGKSFHTAMLMNNQGLLRAMDLHASKLTLVERGACNLGIKILSVSQNDSSKYREEWKDSADRILCDVPCSGLGVISKKPDIRQKQKQEIQRLPAIQSEILECSSRYLKPGGILLYSTCTLNPAENEAVTNAFLNKHPNFRRDPGYPEPLTIFPKGGYIDGFFIDRLIRTE